MSGLGVQRRVALVACAVGVLGSGVAFGPGVGFGPSVAFGPGVAFAASRPLSARTTSAQPLLFFVPGKLETRIGSRKPLAPIPPGFVGASIDYCSITAYMHTAGSGQVLANLLSALANGRALLRVGGNGPEAPCPGNIHHPPSTALRAIRAVERPLNALLLLGVDLEAHRLAKVRREVVALLGGLDPRRPHPRLAAFEIGNEPDRYPRYGPTVPASKTGPFFTRYLRDFSLWAAAIRHSARDGRVPIAGPALGREGLPWITGRNARNLARFADGPARPRYLTFHSYPLHSTSRCPRPDCPSMRGLLSNRSSQGLAVPISKFVARAPPGHTLRVDEMNSITGGGTIGISNTFASALWALDTAFEMAHAGVSGVNFHSFSSAAYALFSNKRSQGWLVHPEYYGLLMFARAAPAGSRLLSVSPSRVRGHRPNVKVWVTRDRDGIVRVLIINKEIVPEYVGLIGRGLPVNAVASLQLLDAEPIGGGTGCPAGYATVGMCAFGDVHLGGQSFGPLVVSYPDGDATTTGLLAPPSDRCDAPLPRNCLIGVRAAGTTFNVPPASALLVSALSR